MSCDAIMTENNSASKSILAREWSGHLHVEQVVTRSRRVKAGVFCSKCGADGLHLEYCNEGCFGKTSKKGEGTVDGNLSDNSDGHLPQSAWELRKRSIKSRSPVALGILWGDSKSKKSDLSKSVKSSEGSCPITTF